MATPDTRNSDTASEALDGGLFIDVSGGVATNGVAVGQAPGANIADTVDTGGLSTEAVPDPNIQAQLEPDAPADTSSTPNDAPTDASTGAPADAPTNTPPVAQPASSSKDGVFVLPNASESGSADTPNLSPATTTIVKALKNIAAMRTGRGADEVAAFTSMLEKGVAPDEAFMKKGWSVVASRVTEMTRADIEASTGITTAAKRTFAASAGDIATLRIAEMLRASGVATAVPEGLSISSILDSALTSQAAPNTGGSTSAGNPTVAFMRDAPTLAAAKAREMYVAAEALGLDSTQVQGWRQSLIDAGYPDPADASAVRSAAQGRDAESRKEAARTRTAAQIFKDAVQQPPISSQVASQLSDGMVAAVQAAQPDGSPDVAIEDAKREYVSDTPLGRALRGTVAKIGDPVLTAAFLASAGNPTAPAPFMDVENSVEYQKAAVAGLLAGLAKVTASIDPDGPGVSDVKSIGDLVAKIGTIYPSMEAGVDPADITIIAGSNGSPNRYRFVASADNTILTRLVDEAYPGMFKNKTAKENLVISLARFLNQDHTQEIGVPRATTAAAAAGLGEDPTTVDGDIGAAIEATSLDASATGLSDGRDQPDQQRTPRTPQQDAGMLTAAVRGPHEAAIQADSNSAAPDSAAFTPDEVGDIPALYGVSAPRSFLEAVEMENGVVTGYDTTRIEYVLDAYGNVDVAATLAAANAIDTQLQDKGMQAGDLAGGFESAATSVLQGWDFEAMGRAAEFQTSYVEHGGDTVAAILDEANPDNFGDTPKLFRSLAVMALQQAVQRDASDADIQAVMSNLVDAAGKMGLLDENRVDPRRQVFDLRGAYAYDLTTLLDKVQSEYANTNEFTARMSELNSGRLNTLSDAVLQKMQADGVQVDEWTASFNRGYVATALNATGGSAISLVSGITTAAAVAASGGSGALVVVAGAAASGTTGFTVEHAMTLASAAQNEGIAFTTPEEIAKALRNPEFMAKARADALKRGIIIGSAEGISTMLELATGGLAKGVTSPVKRVLAEAALGLGTGAVVGVAGDVAADVATDRQDLSKLSGSQLAAMFVTEMFVGTAMSATGVATQAYAASKAPPSDANATPTPADTANSVVNAFVEDAETNPAGPGIVAGAAKAPSDAALDSQGLDTSGTSETTPLDDALAQLDEDLAPDADPAEVADHAEAAAAAKQAKDLAEEAPAPSAHAVPGGNDVFSEFVNNTNLPEPANDARQAASEAEAIRSAAPPDEVVAAVENAAVAEAPYRSHAEDAADIALINAISDAVRDQHSGDMLVTGPGQSANAAEISRKLSKSDRATADATRDLLDMYSPGYNEANAAQKGNGATHTVSDAATQVQQHPVAGPVFQALVTESARAVRVVTAALSDTPHAARALSARVATVVSEVNDIAQRQVISVKAAFDAMIEDRVNAAANSGARTAEASATLQTDPSIAAQLEPAQPAPSQDSTSLGGTLADAAPQATPLLGVSLTQLPGVSHTPPLGPLPKADTAIQLALTVVNGEVSQTAKPHVAATAEAMLALSRMSDLAAQETTIVPDVVPQENLPSADPSIPDVAPDRADPAPAEDASPATPDLTDALPGSDLTAAERAELGRDLTPDPDVQKEAASAVSVGFADPVDLGASRSSAQLLVQQANAKARGREGISKTRGQFVAAINKLMGSLGLPEFVAQSAEPKLQPRSAREQAAYGAMSPIAKAADDSQRLDAHVAAVKEYHDAGGVSFRQLYADALVHLSSQMRSNAADAAAALHVVLDNARKGSSKLLSTPLSQLGAAGAKHPGLKRGLYRKPSETRDARRARWSKTAKKLSNPVVVLGEPNIQGDISASIAHDFAQRLGMGKKASRTSKVMLLARSMQVDHDAHPAGAEASMSEYREDVRDALEAVGVKDAGGHLDAMADLVISFQRKTQSRAAYDPDSPTGTSKGRDGNGVPLDYVTLPDGKTNPLETHVDNRSPLGAHMRIPLTPDTGARSVSILSIDDTRYSGAVTNSNTSTSDSAGVDNALNRLEDSLAPTNAATPADGRRASSRTSTVVDLAETIAHEMGHAATLDVLMDQDAKSITSILQEWVLYHALVTAPVLRKRTGSPGPETNAGAALAAFRDDQRAGKRSVSPTSGTPISGTGAVQSAVVGHSAKNAYKRYNDAVKAGERAVKKLIDSIRKYGGLPLNAEALINTADVETRLAIIAADPDLKASFHEFIANVVGSNLMNETYTSDADTQLSSSLDALAAQGDAANTATLPDKGVASLADRVARKKRQSAARRFVNTLSSLYKKVASGLAYNGYQPNYVLGAPTTYLKAYDFIQQSLKRVTEDTRFDAPSAGVHRAWIAVLTDRANVARYQRYSQRQAEAAAGASLTPEYSAKLDQSQTMAKPMIEATLPDNAEIVYTRKPAFDEAEPIFRVRPARKAGNDGSARPVVEVNVRELFAIRNLYGGGDAAVAARLDDFRFTMAREVGLRSALGPRGTAALDDFLVRGTPSATQDADALQKLRDKAIRSLPSDASDRAIATEILRDVFADVSAETVVSHRALGNEAVNAILDGSVGVGKAADTPVTLAKLLHTAVSASSTQFGLTADQLSARASAPLEVREAADTEKAAVDAGFESDRFLSSRSAKPLRAFDAVMSGFSNAARGFHVLGQAAEKALRSLGNDDLADDVKRNMDRSRNDVSALHARKGRALMQLADAGVEDAYVSAVKDHITFVSNTLGSSDNGAEATVHVNTYMYLRAELQRATRYVLLHTNIPTDTPDGVTANDARRSIVDTALSGISDSARNGDAPSVQRAIVERMHTQLVALAKSNPVYAASLSDPGTQQSSNPATSTGKSLAVVRAELDDYLTGVADVAQARLGGEAPSAAALHKVFVDKSFVDAYDRLTDRVIAAEIDSGRVAPEVYAVDLITQPDHRVDHKRVGLSGIGSPIGAPTPFADTSGTVLRRGARGADTPASSASLAAKLDPVAGALTSLRQALQANVHAELHSNAAQALMLVSSEAGLGGKDAVRITDPTPMHIIAVNEATGVPFVHDSPDAAKLLEDADAEAAAGQNLRGRGQKQQSVAVTFLTTADGDLTTTRITDPAIVGAFRSDQHGRNQLRGGPRASTQIQDTAIGRILRNLTGWFGALHTAMDPVFTFAIDLPRNAAEAYAITAREQRLGYVRAIGHFVKASTGAAAPVTQLVFSSPDTQRRLIRQWSKLPTSTARRRVADRYANGAFIGERQVIDSSDTVYQELRRAADQEVVDFSDISGDVTERMRQTIVEEKKRFSTYLATAVLDKVTGFASVLDNIGRQVVYDAAYSRAISDGEPHDASTTIASAAARGVLDVTTTGKGVGVLGMLYPFMRSHAAGMEALFDRRVWKNGETPVKVTVVDGVLKRTVSPVDVVSRLDAKYAAIIAGRTAVTTALSVHRAKLAMVAAAAASAAAKGLTDDEADDYMREVAQAYDGPSGYLRAWRENLAGVSIRNIIANDFIHIGAAPDGSGGNLKIGNPLGVEASVAGLMRAAMLIASGEDPGEVSRVWGAFVGMNFAPVGVGMDLSATASLESLLPPAITAMLDAASGERTLPNGLSSSVTPRNAGAGSGSTRDVRAQENFYVAELLKSMGPLANADPEATLNAVEAIAGGIGRMVTGALTNANDVAVFGDDSDVLHAIGGDRIDAGRSDADIERSAYSRYAYSRDGGKRTYQGLATRINVLESFAANRPLSEREFAELTAARSSAKSIRSVIASVSAVSGALNSLARSSAPQLLSPGTPDNIRTKLQEDLRSMRSALAKKQFEANIAIERALSNRGLSEFAPRVVRKGKAALAAHDARSGY